MPALFQSTRTTGDTIMRVMVLIKANEKSEAGIMPSEQLLNEMTKYNEELVNAGIMLTGEGLRPSSKGKRVRFQDGKTTVIDGPFAETKELIAGFWIWKVKTMDEAVEWIKRVPNTDAEPGEVAESEIRQISEMEDFGDAYTEEMREAAERMRRQLAG